MRVALLSAWGERCGVTDHSAALEGALTAHGLEVSRVPLRPPRAALDADVAHVQFEPSLLAPGHAAAMRRLAVLVNDLDDGERRVVVTFHAEPPRHPATRLLWRLMVARRFHHGARLHAIAHTEATRAALVRSGLPAGRTHVIPLGVTAGAPGPGRAAARERLGLPGEATVLLMFGFLLPHKGIDLAIEALAELPEDHLLVIAGGAHPRHADPTPELHAAARAHGVAERVRLLGHVESADLPDLAAAADLFLAPYRPEPPLSASAAVAWAIGHELPVVASAIPAFGELGRDGSALLVAPGRAGHLAAAVRELGTDPERAAELRRAARRRAADASWTRVAAMHAQLYAGA